MCNSTLSQRGDKNAVENGDLLMPKFDSDGLIAAVVTDVETGEVWHDNIGYYQVRNRSFKERHDL